jgi:hypothetical protein
LDTAIGRILRSIACIFFLPDAPHCRLRNPIAPQIVPIASSAGTAIDVLAAAQPPSRAFPAPACD